MTFLLTTPILIGFLVILFILISAMVETENSGWATTFFSISIALLFWHHWESIWGWVSLNPIDTLIFIGGYILGGIIWSVIKWKSYISRPARFFEELKKEFTTKHGKIGANWKKWIEILNYHAGKLNSHRYTFYEKDEPEDIVKKMTISARDKKQTIVSWIAYWPMSLMATLLNDPVRRFMSWIYEGISGLFQNMSNRSAKNLGKGMEKFGDEHQDSK